MEDTRPNWMRDSHRMLQNKLSSAEVAEKIKATYTLDAGELDVAVERCSQSLANSKGVEWGDVRSRDWLRKCLATYNLLKSGEK